MGYLKRRIDERMIYYLKQISQNAISTLIVKLEIEFSLLPTFHRTPFRNCCRFLRIQFHTQESIFLGFIAKKISLS